MPHDRPDRTSRAETVQHAAWYVAAFGAVAGGPFSSAEAQVVYTNPDDIRVQDTYEADGGTAVVGFGIDLDDDDDDEIIFAEASNGAFTLAATNVDFPDNEDDDDTVTAIVGQLVEYAPGSNAAYFAPLGAGYVIPDDVGADNGFIDGFSFATFTLNSMNPQGFVFGADQFIGFQFATDAGDVHNAWVRIELISGGGLIIKDYAYNATPEAPIAVGEGIETAGEESPGLDGPVARVLGVNPFTAAGTRLQVGVATDEHVRVEVFNALGQRVETLYDGALIGEKALRFGQAYAPGLYVVRITGETFRQTLKVTRG